MRQLRLITKHFLPTFEPTAGLDPNGFTAIDDDYCYISPYCADYEAEISQILSTLRKCAKKSIAIECVILYAKGYDYKEISQLLGIPKGTVMSRISNGRKMLRNALQR